MQIKGDTTFEKIRYVFGRIAFRLNKFMFYKHKITRSDKKKFSKLIDGKGKSLVVFSDFDYEQILTDCDVMPRHLFETDKYLDYFKDYPEGAYDSVICMGLLEHMKEPSKLIENIYKALKSGGKVYIYASSVFSIHRGPEDYFRFTHYGARVLLERFEWNNLEIFGSCGPFRTLGINCQRILWQSEINILFKPFLELLAWLLPLLDFAVKKQYDGHRFEEERRIDSMMPSNIWIIATK